MEDYIKQAKQDRERCADFLNANPSVHVVVTETAIRDRNGGCTPQQPIDEDNDGACHSCVVLAQEVLRLGRVLQQQERFIDEVERLAFMMNPPNAYTPRFLQLCIEAKRLINLKGNFDE